MNEHGLESAQSVYATQKYKHCVMIAERATKIRLLPRNHAGLLAFRREMIHALHVFKAGARYEALQADLVKLDAYLRSKGLIP